MTDLQQRTPHAPATVYVAATTRELEAVRGKIVRQLQDWGCEVMPDPSSLAASSPAVREYIDRELARSRLSVHLVGP